MKTSSFLPVFIISSCLLLSACSTREVVSVNSGATSQRLITHSIEQLIESFPEEDFAKLQNKSIWLNSHFIGNEQFLSYADNMLRLSLQQRFNINLTEQEDAEFELNVFFTAMGTDSDTAGLSVPLVNLSDTSQSSSIDIFAIDMYHGVAECLYYIKQKDSSDVVKYKKVKARVRTDKISTPIVSFPLSTID